MYDSTTELQGEVLQPESIQQHRRVPIGGSIQPSYPFVAVFHHNWEYLENEHFPDGKWLPQLSDVRTAPNGNGVKVKDKQIESGQMLQGLRAKKSIIIERFDPRLGDLGAYLKRVLTDSGEYMYMYAWTTVVLIDNGRRGVVKKDLATEYRFRQRLVDSHYIPAMPRQSVDTHVARIRETLRRLRREADRARLDHKAYDARREELEAHIAKMYAAWERDYGTSATVSAPQAQAETDFVLGELGPDGDGVPGVSLPSEPSPPSPKRGK